MPGENFSFVRMIPRGQAQYGGVSPLDLQFYTCGGEEEEIPNRQDLLRHARLNCGTNLSSLRSAASPSLPSLNLGSAVPEILAHPGIRKLLDKRIDVRSRRERRRGTVPTGLAGL